MQQNQQFHVIPVIRDNLLVMAQMNQRLYKTFQAD